MIQGRRVLAVVPARGGSKGIPLKNLRQIRGQTLVARVGAIIAAIPEIDRSVVSTDHEDIAEEAESAGIDAPFRRPPELSGDQVGDYDVLIDALGRVETLDQCRYDIVLMLQPTSPLRTPAHVTATLRMLVDGRWDSVWTVSPTDTKAHPLKQLVLSADGALDYYDPRGAQIIARQQLTAVYHRNGIAYAMTRECLVEQKAIKGERNGALVVDGEHVSIDTERDLTTVEALLARQLHQ